MDSGTALVDVASKTIRSNDLQTLLVLGSLLIVLATAVGSLLWFSLVGPVGIATAAAGLLSLLALRHVTTLRRSRAAMRQAWSAARRGGVPDATVLPPTYFLYVLGSGGHTGELCEMVKQQFRPHPRSHRRYVITSGDQHSEHAVARLEGRIQQAFPSAGSAGSLPGPGGTWDVARVVRARRVHQPLWTSWLSAAHSALTIFEAIYTRPVERSDAGAFDAPHLIVTNGPGTGFVVCLVAHLLKFLCLVPADRCTILYIETWAHVSTLSLTGRLFYYSGMADLFVVQHKALAATTGQRFIGEVAKYGNLLGVRKTLDRPRH